MKNPLLFVCAPLAFVAVVPAHAQSISSVTQSGIENTANVTQQGSNRTTIEQIGQTNLANSQQSGSGNEATITQDGVNASDAGVFQVAVDSIAQILQTGGANLSNATINQFEGSVSNTARIEQSGAVVDGPTAIIEQRGGPSNSATIIQGDTIPFGGGVTTAPNTYADTFQVGEANQSEIVQGGFLQWARNNGIGSDNASQITQGAIGGGEGVVFVIQLSDANISTVVQNSSANVVELIQEVGVGNESRINQGFVDGLGVGGDNNVASVLQQGSDNFNLIEQNLLTSGGSNSATVNQFGNGHSSSISQEGTGNVAEVTQGIGTGASCAVFGGNCGF